MKITEDAGNCPLCGNDTLDMGYGLAGGGGLGVYYFCNTKECIYFNKNDMLQGLKPDDVIPVLAAHIAGLGVYGDIDPDKLTSFVAGIIRDTYRLNIAPPMKDRN